MLNNPLILIAGTLLFALLGFLAWGLNKLLHELKTSEQRQISRFHEFSEKINVNTGSTFTDIIKRLALIDDAQKKLHDLSSNVVSLQEILTDKRSRGAFGEVQLQNLIHNMIPENKVAMQHTLSTGVRADCVLFLPEPIGNLVVDSKFPLENYQKMTDFELGEADKKTAKQQFKQDLKKHIQDISSKYIIEGETATGALMFIPAEAIFAEIHTQHNDIVTLAHQKQVWLASPTTMMAILTTISSVLKDDATKEHVHVIQQHLRMLAKDFARFEDRMEKLSKHINQAKDDVDQVNKSAKKITSRFGQIERAELAQDSLETLEH